MDHSFLASSHRSVTARRKDVPLVVFALEPRSYSEAIGTAVAELRPCLRVAMADPEDLPAETERRAPDLVLCSRPRPEGCNAAVRWTQYRPYEDPEVVRVDGRAERTPGLDLGDLLALIDRLCGGLAKSGGRGTSLAG